MKKNRVLNFAAALLCVALLVSLACFGSKAAGALSIAVEKATAATGGTATVVLNVKENPGDVSALVIGVSYDKTVLELESGANGSLFSNMTAGSNYVWYDAAGVSGTGTLLTLTFKVSSTAAVGEYPITVTVYECYDINEKDVATTVTNGTVNVTCGHKNTKNVAATAATCVAGGYTAGVWCNDCETYISGHEAVAATGVHTYGAAVVNKQATCTEKGSQTATCTVCKKTVTEDIAALGHTEVIDAAVAATCTESGLTQGKHCSVCNETLVAQTVVAAKGHNKVTDAAKAATCTESGLTEGSHCANCGLIYTAQETINPLGHKKVNDSAKAATCMKTGLTEGSHCSVCKTVLVAQSTVPAKGHSYGEWVITKAATETENGERTKTCAECGDVVTEVIPKIGGTSEPTTEEDKPEPTDGTEALEPTTEDDSSEPTDGTEVLEPTTEEEESEPTDEAEISESTTEEDSTDPGEDVSGGNSGKTTGWIWWLLLLLLLIALAVGYYIYKKKNENNAE